MTYVKMGAVRALPGVQPDEAQALKPLKEAAEVFGAWKMLCYGSLVQISSERMRGMVLAEIADTIQACANLAVALGVTDLTPYMAECEERNRERGRYERA